MDWEGISSGSPLYSLWLREIPSFGSGMGSPLLAQGWAPFFWLREQIPSFGLGSRSTLLAQGTDPLFGLREQIPSFGSVSRSPLLAQGVDPLFWLCCYSIKLRDNLSEA